MGAGDANQGRHQATMILTGRGLAVNVCCRLSLLLLREIFHQVVSGVTRSFRRVRHDHLGGYGATMGAGDANQGRHQATMILRGRGLAVNVCCRLSLLLLREIIDQVVSGVTRSFRRVDHDHLGGYGNLNSRVRHNLGQT